MKITEIYAKSILSKSQVYDYALNPYVGCGHSCRYCYAAFMKRFTGHREKWGGFVDVKVNAAELLAKEIVKRKRVGRIWVSGVCDPYQPVEKDYELTRKCLEIIVKTAWPVTIQTKSPLVLRDLDILKKSREAEVGFTITTADESIRSIFEPGAPPLKERIDVLAALHSEGIKTFAMIAPILPGVEGLVNELSGKVDWVMVDRLNYHYADSVYRKNKIEWAMEYPFFVEKGEELQKGFESKGIPCNVLF
jgi:DNA repair photolyase